MASALFGSGQNRNQSKNLVEFKAGKMFMKNKMVHPDKRKGMVFIYQADDGLMHFCWKDRGTGRTEDDLLIFPDDTEFKSVPQCKTGRVFLLKFKSTTRKLFFWMQEPKTDKDEDYCSKVNDFLNNPPAPGSARGGGGGGGGLSLPAEFGGSNADFSDMQSMLGQMSQQQLMQLLGNMGMQGMTSLLGRPSSAQSESTPPSRIHSSPGARTRSAADSATPTAPRPVTAAALPSQPSTTRTPAPAAATTVGSSEKPATTTADNKEARPSSAGGIQLSDLQNILTGIGGAAATPREPIDLSTAITPEAMIPILSNPDVQARLMPHLPEGGNLPKNEQELRNTISTPQFQQAMQSFSAALGSGQLGALMGQFGLGDDATAAAAAGDVEAFVKAMQAREKPDDKKDKDEEKMEH